MAMNAENQSAWKLLKTGFLNEMANVQSLAQRRRGRFVLKSSTASHMLENPHRYASALKDLHNRYRDGGNRIGMHR
jgi:hypothetical protein